MDRFNYYKMRIILGSYLLCACLTSHAQEDVRVLLKPLMKATLSSELAAKITQLSVRAGEKISKDQLLVAFDCAIPKAERNKAKADYNGTYQTYQSNKQMRELGSYSKLELAIARSHMQQAQATLNIHKVRVALCQLSAPFSGVVVDVMASAHEYVTQGQPLLSILSNQQLEAELFVPSGWLSWLSIGTTLNIHISETGKTYLASITRLGSQVDAVSQSIAVWAEMSHSDSQLLSGMSGLAHFPTAPSDE